MLRPGDPSCATWRVTLPSITCLRFSACTVALLIVLFLSLPHQGRSQTEPLIGGQAARISVNVDLVVLHATVRDRRGHFVSDLNKRDFQIYEDGVPQAVRLFRHEDIPVTVGLVVDHSGSMRSKIADVIAAARAFARSSNADDEMFVVNFNEHVTLGLPTTVAFTNRPDQLEAAILKATITGQTALYDAVSAALERLQGAHREKKVLVVLSDGADNASKISLAEVLTKAGQSTALIYTVGMFEEGSHDRNPRVLKQLARATGGEAFFPRQPGEVLTICENIARDIRNQYTLGYLSTSGVQSGAYRSIRVLAGPPGSGRLLVRTRAGYVAGREAAK
jgi:Ca-activated chloride channel family protein